MSTLSIVAITVFSSLFVILMLIAAAANIYAHLQLRKQISEATTLISGHRSAMDLTVRDIGVTLESHRSKMDGLIQKINGEEIATAAKAIISSTARIEKATIAFGELTRALLSEGAIGGSDISRAIESGLEPESYAPNPTNERYASLSRTAAGDIEAADELDNQE